jgi:hypothetical protein
MIRWVFIAALTSLLCIVLYIPSAVPAERFIEVLRAEHTVAEQVWGLEISTRILDRMIDLQQATPTISTPPAATVRHKAGPDVNAAMVDQVNQTSQRLFGNPYFRSIDALFALVSYRLSTALELLPLLAAFLGVVCVDGLVIRQVRAKEFIAHSAEMFGISILGAIALSSIAVVVCFLPIPMHPMFMTLSLLVTLFVLSRAIANYHVIH